MTVMIQGPERRAWLTAGVWLLFQLTLTTLPGSAFPPVSIHGLDRVAHFCIYFGLAVLLTRAWLTGGRKPAFLLLLWLGCAVLGALDELHQLFSPGRSADVADWQMDLAGSAAGFIVGYLIMRTRWAVFLR